MRLLKKAILAGILFFLSFNLFANNEEINLVVSYKTVTFAGKSVKAIAVNNQIPAPTLHFKEGDHVTINVYNHLDKETAIHWHGMLVPWQMDGVLGLSQHGIQPGGIFHYQFTLHQSGTYWYHAHAGLQEQQGLYGAFLIDPSLPPAYHYTKDYVVVLSDWSNTQPDKIFANLKKEGDYYSPKFPLQPSLMKFIHDYRQASPLEKQKLLDDYKIMQKMRMSIYDFSDVAYDTFLLNGQPPSTLWTAPVKVGDTVRLRFIGAGASTIFRVKIPGTSMQMVHVEGNDVRPYRVNDFTIAPGETYDVLVKIEKKQPYIIYAESIDTVGAAYGALITSPNQYVNIHQVAAFPEPLPVTREMMSMMMGPMIKGVLPSQAKTLFIPSTNNISSMAMTQDISPSDHATSQNEMSMSHNMPMEHTMASSSSNGMAMTQMNMSTPNEPMNMDMPTESTLKKDVILPPNSTFVTSANTKYAKMIAVHPTNNPDTPVYGVINMELFGYMDHFIWFINGVPEYNASPIVLKPNKRYRFVFTNTSMMHHPMHIHGHWFILREGKGAYDPLLHTIDIPPGAIMTADVDTDASGQWFFHCHLLYHMMAGMARTIQYSTIIDIAQQKALPQNIIAKTGYYNRPIVRVDTAAPIDPELIMHPMPHSTPLSFATFINAGINPVTNFENLTYKGLYGTDYNRLELYTNDAQMEKGNVENADMDIFYWHLISQFWAIKGGVNYFYKPAEEPYWQPGIGIEGLMPYFINTDIRSYFHAGSAKLDMEFSRDIQITNNFFLSAGIRSILATKTVEQASIGSGLNEMRYTVRPYYRLMPGLSLYAEFEREKDYGDFQSIQIENGESAKQNSLTFGISLLL